MRLLLIALICGLAQLISASMSKAEPSFDCKKASTRVEHLICGNDALSLLDKQAADVFQQAQQRRGIDKDALLWGQRFWLKDRTDDCLRDEPDTRLIIRCLSKIYQDRIEALKSEVAGTRLPERDRAPCEAMRSALQSRDPKAVDRVFLQPEDTHSVDPQSLLSDEEIAKTLWGKGAPDISHSIHLSDDKHADLVLQSVVGTLECSRYFFFLHDGTGALHAVNQPDIAAYEEEGGLCQADDSSLRFVRFDGKTYIQVESILGGGQTLFFAVDRNQILSLKCRLHTSQKNMPIDFEVTTDTP